MLQIFNDFYKSLYIAKRIIRGYSHRFLIKKSGKKLRIGDTTTLLNLNHLTIGNNCLIDDFTFINAKSLRGIIIGNNVTINRNCYLHGFGERNGEGILIGDNVTIGNNGIIYGHALVKIGSNCAIGPNVVIIPENHNYQELKIPIRKQGCTRKRITIEENVWIGSNSVILAGVTIHQGAIIAAGAVVTKDIPPDVIAGGIPAQIIKHR